MIADPRPYLLHIKDACNLIQSFTAGLSEDNFKKNVEKQSAVIRQIEIIGEAVRNLPEDLKNNNPDVPWKSISSMRNLLIHEYFDVDTDQVWNTSTKEVPELERKVEKILAQL